MPELPEVETVRRHLERHLVGRTIVRAWISGKKLRRLGIPLIVASTLLYGLHSSMHHPVPPLLQIWTIYAFPYWHLWFVQALLVVFAALVVLESVRALSTFTRFMGVFALSLALYGYGPFESSNVFGVHNATYLLPFFLGGLAAHRFRCGYPCPSSGRRGSP